ncbi:NACHT nucleoside triphosphatase [Penicillium odoratum]|uniref:NACHT nucleoside triphosphatase n=1 Tax=Penicillium odoratum TaxID=1167516 RepID=UPI0025484C2F|nr:NACHT nucleoside triphosphatase [Penicillium odoratum]KAJ5752473.1 NACHT nucleoside triphosphatase [Penicillium odoratum]
MASNISFQGVNTGNQFGNNSGHANITQIFNSGPPFTDGCLRDLRTTNPHDDKDRIQNTNGGLLKDSYRWILDNREFKQWKSDENNDNRLLWIRGDPGKGKTMLLCGIIDELSSTVETANVSSFFCQATDPRINNATAVLRGLIYSLVEKQPSLLHHVQVQYSQAEKEVFHDRNAGHALSRIFSNILKDSTMQSTYLVVDALDECTQDHPFLLDFIIKESSAYPQVRWLVSSRNWRDIEERLHAAAHTAPISLELNEVSVSEAVRKFIQYRMHQLVEVKKYNNLTRDAISDHLLANAHGTFLWVALARQELTRTPRWQALQKLAAFPPRLNALYGRMIDQIRNSEGAELYKRILAVMSTVYRPTTLDELQSCMDMPDVIYDYEDVSEVIAFCGSFPNVRNNTINFVHQSAKDFLKMSKSQDLIKRVGDVLRFIRYFKTAIENAPLQVYISALVFSPTQSMTRVCFRTVSPEWVIMKSAPEDYWHPCLQTLEGYNTCVVWSHARNQLASASPDGTINIWDPNTGQRISSLKGHSDNGARLASLGYGGTIKIWDPDTQQCVLTRKEIKHSIRCFAWSYDGIRIALALERGNVKIWDLKTDHTDHYMSIIGHDRSEWASIAWSPDGSLLASRLSDSTVRIWNPVTSQCISTLGRAGNPGLFHSYSVEWSYDGSRLAMAYSGFVEIWNPRNGQRIANLDGGSTSLRLQWKIPIAWLNDATRLASSLSTPNVMIWNPTTGERTSILRGHSRLVSAIAWSHDGIRLASGSEDCTIRIWNPVTAQCISILRGHFGDTFALFWSKNGSQIISGSDDGAIKIWDPSTDRNTSTPDGHTDRRSIAWSCDGQKLASVSNDLTVKIWDKYTGKCTSTLEGHEACPIHIAWSRHSTWLLSTSLGNLRVWDTVTGQCISILRHTHDIDLCVWSDEGTLIASSSYDGTFSTIIIWNQFTEQILCVFKPPHDAPVHALAWSHNGTMLASASNGDEDRQRFLGRKIHIWKPSTGEIVWSYCHTFRLSVISWSYDDTRLVAGGRDIMIFDLTNDSFSTIEEGHGKTISYITWSRDGSKIAYLSSDMTVYIWYLDGTGPIKQTHIEHVGLYGFVRFDEVDSNILHTAIGTLKLQPYNPDPWISPMPKWVGYGLKHDSCWITFEGKDLLWLPPSTGQCTHL